MNPKKLSKYIVSSCALFLVTNSLQVASAKTFYEVIDVALKTNPQIFRFKAATKTEEYALKSIRGQYLPSVDVSAGIGREHTDTKSGNNKNNKTLTRREARASLSQLIFDANGVWSTYNQQAAKVRSAQMSLSDSKEKIGLQAVQAYLDSVRTREIVRLAKANENEHLETLEKVKELYSGGAGRKGDIDLAEGRLARTRAVLTTFENNIRVANSNFKSIVGEDLNYDVNWPDFSEHYLPKSLDEAIETALKNNPNLLSAFEESVSAQWAIKTSKTSFWPRVNLELSSTKNKNIDGVIGRNNDAQIMLKANWNLLRGGSDIANYHQNIYRYSEANEIVSATRRLVIQKVTDAWNQYNTAKRKQEELKKHMLTSRKVLDAYEEQFKYGQRQLFNVLDQKNELFNSKVDFVNGQSDVIRSAHVLMSELGLLVDYVVAERQKEINKLRVQEVAKNRKEMAKKQPDSNKREF